MALDDIGEFSNKKEEEDQEVKNLDSPNIDELELAFTQFIVSISQAEMCHIET